MDNNKKYSKKVNTAAVLFVALYVIVILVGIGMAAFVIYH